MPSWSAEDGTYHNDFSTLLWRGELGYAGLVARDWYSIGGPAHPLFTTLVDRIWKEVPAAREYSLLVNGGLLEEWMSWDVDLSLIGGEWNPVKIKEAMQGILQIAFELHLFVDLKWQESFWRPDLMTLDDLHEYECWCWELANDFTRDGEVRPVAELIPHSGLWRRWNYYPFDKHVDRLKAGYVYQAPLVLWEGPEK